MNKLVNNILLCLISLCILWPAQGSAQLTQSAKLAPPVIQSNYGQSVANSGDLLAIGSDFFGPGSVHIYQRDKGGANKWGYLTSVVASDGLPHDYFGSHLALDGDVLIVGAPGKNSNAGAAYVFERNYGGTDRWGQVRKLSEIGSTYLGSSVAVSGDTVLIGAGPTDSAAGVVYLYQRNQGSTNNWGKVKTLKASDSSPGNLFGSVSISGDMVVVGASGRGSGTGAAYVFERNAGGQNNWGQVKIIVPSDAAARDGFGSSLSASGDLIIIGAHNANATIDEPRNNGSGAAYIFSRVNGYSQLRKLHPSELVLGDHFGITVSIRDDTAVVGAYGSNLRAGSAYVFSRGRGGANKFGLLKKLIDSGLTANAQFGAATSTSSSVVVVGAPQISATYVYRFNGR